VANGESTPLAIFYPRVTQKATILRSNSSSSANEPKSHLKHLQKPPKHFNYSSFSNLTPNDRISIETGISLLSIGSWC